MKLRWYFLLPILLSVVSACRPTPIPPALTVTVTPTVAQPTSMPTATASATLVRATATATRATATPTSAPATPTALALLPLGDRLQAGQQLGLQWAKSGAERVFYFERGGELEPRLGYAVSPMFDTVTVLDLAGTWLYTLRVPGWWVNQGDAVYAADSSSGQPAVLKYSLSTGKLLWQTTLTATDDLIALAADSHGVAAVAGQTLHLLDPETGQVEWTAQLGGCSQPELYLTDQAVHAWCRDNLWRLDRATGASSASVPVAADTSYANVQWAGGTLYAQRTDWKPQYRYNIAEQRFLEARDADSYALRWSVPLTTTGTCQFQSDQADVLYACGSRLARLDGASGEAMWRATLGSGDAPADVPTGPWAFYQADVIYTHGNQVARFDGATGRLVWQMTVQSQALASVTVMDDRLLIGTKTGFLHVLQAATGELTWEQDVWGSVEPRDVYMRPLGVTTQTLVIAGQRHLLALAVDDAGQPPTATPRAQPAERATATVTARPGVQPTRRPTATAQPPATATRYPVFTPPAPDATPTPPVDWLDWPAAITAYLNAAPDDETRLATLLEAWHQPGQTLASQPLADLDGDGQLELIVTLTTGYFGEESWLAVIRPTQGHYELAWLDASGVPDELPTREGAAHTGYAVADLNADGRSDLVYVMSSYGVCSSYSWVTPLSWDGTALVSLDPAGVIAMNDLSDMWLTPQPGSAQKQIAIIGGYSGCGSQQSQQYAKTNTYRLRAGVYTLEHSVPWPGRDYYFYLLDANEMLLDGDNLGASAMLEDSLTSSAPWHPTETGMAFAEYQLMLANLRLGNETAAAYWATTGHYPAELYSQVKAAFWQEYQATNDWTAAAEAARLRARLAGPERMQPWPIDWAGFPGYITLEQICPCPDCVQGPVAVWDYFGPP